MRLKLKAYFTALWCACCVIVTYMYGTLMKKTDVPEISKESGPVHEEVGNSNRLTTMPLYNDEVLSTLNYSDYATESFTGRAEFTEERMEKNEVEAENHPQILVWNAAQTPGFRIPRDGMCGGGCRLSDDRAILYESDAVVFSMKEFNADDIPNRNLRRSDQVYVWWSEESPWMTKHIYNVSETYTAYDENFFNWTMTYKTNSDVNGMMFPYNAKEFVMEQMKSRSKNGKDIKINNRMKSKSEQDLLRTQALKLIRKKTRSAIWIASNCGYTAAAVLRRKIVTELQFSGLEVDIFGHCGDPNVPEDLAEFLNLISQYKFNLAFENSFHCRDYITEKFWYNSLYAGTIPIVWGPTKSDIEAVAPAKSFIFFEDYNSTEELVRHLNSLETEDNAYLEYFSWWWKSSETFPIYGIHDVTDDLKGRKALFDFELNAFCDLCRLLNEGTHKKAKKFVRSLESWWFHGESTKCLDINHGAKLVKYGSGYQVFELD